MSTTASAPGISGTGEHQTLTAVAAVGIGLATLADWLFYDRPVGISLALFAAALVIVSAIVNRALTTPRRIALAAMWLVLALLPVAIEVTTLSVLFAVIGTIGGAMIATGMLSGTLMQKVLRFGAVALLAPVQISDDLARLPVADSARVTRWLGRVAVWLLPLGLGMVFSGLLISANPLLENWVGKVDFRALFADLTAIRIVLWLLVIFGTWSVVWLRRREVPSGLPVSISGAASVSAASKSLVFGEGAIVRSLLVVNLVFAVQTLMDLTYLWGGSTLPEGMTLATYAHRGAYPLIVTAVLAGLFVVAAMQPGGPGHGSALVRELVYAWIAQNVALVVSAMLRLKLYVEVYSLSYLRVAAFVWMLLVAFGLILIVVQIWTRRSNSWLVAANAMAAAAALYACCFVNFPAVIASYNITHSGWLGGPSAQGTPVSLDTCYLLGLGPQAIPAIDRIGAGAKEISCPRQRNIYTGTVHGAVNRRELAASHLRDSADWRGWSWRGSRLSAYLRDAAAARPE